MTRRTDSAEGRPPASAPSRKGVGILAAWVAALALAGCSGTPGAARTDESNRSPGASGITVFGDVDMGVRRERSR